MKKLGVSAAHITIEINTDSQAGYSLHVPSDESIQKLNNWFFRHDFGYGEAEEFETAFYTVIYLRLSNKNADYSKVDELIKIIRTAANKILKK